MATIQGHIGKRDPLISILRTGLQSSTKHRKRAKIEIAAIERFEQPNTTGGSWIYIMTPIPQTLTRHPEKLKAYLEEHRRQHGRYLPTDHEWRQGTKYSGNQDTAPGARTTPTPDFTREISGNLAHKSSRQIQKLIRQADEANMEFIAILTPINTSF
jgi:hypothetical protein